MPVNKFYSSQDESESRLECFQTSDNFCRIKMVDEPHDQFNYIELSAEDLYDLINELIYIKTQIDSNELH